MSWFRVSKFRDTARVGIGDNIGEGADVRDLLQEIDDAPEIELSINSCGGSAEATEALFNAIKGRCPLATITGRAASCGALLTLAADRVRIASAGTVMLHAPRLKDTETAAALTAGQLRRLAADLEAIEALWLDRLLDRVTVDLQTACRWLSGPDETFTAERALAVGLAHEVFAAPATEETSELIVPPDDAQANDADFLETLQRFGPIRTGDRKKLFSNLNMLFALNLREVS